MKHEKLFGIVLLGVGLYAYHNADTGTGFLGLTNSTIPGMALIVIGVLLLAGIV